MARSARLLLALLLAHLETASGVLLINARSGHGAGSSSQGGAAPATASGPAAEAQPKEGQSQEARSHFVPAAMSRSPIEFFRLSWDHVVFAAERVTRRKTWLERYKQGPANRMQDISQPYVWGQVIRRAAITFGIFQALVLLFVRFCDPRDYPLEQRKDTDRDPEAEWNVGPMSAMEDMRITKWALFCPGIRWAYTAEQTGFMGFWLAFWLLSMLWMIKWVYFWICTWFMIFDLTGLALICHRRRLRKQLGLSTGILTWFQDCFLSFFCAFNVIQHEARVAEAVLKEKASKTVD